jgi:hypothetical protein
MEEKKAARVRGGVLPTYAKKKNEDNIRRVNQVIDELRAEDHKINFETVARLSGVSRGTLYNNEELRDRIQRLRADGTDRQCQGLREKNERQAERLRDMRRQIVVLQEEKKKLIAQLIDCDMLRQENERLRQALRGENGRK